MWLSYTLKQFQDNDIAMIAIYTGIYIYAYYNGFWFTAKLRMIFIQFKKRWNFWQMLLATEKTIFKTELNSLNVIYIQVFSEVSDPQS